MKYEMDVRVFGHMAFESDFEAGNINDAKRRVLGMTLFGMKVFGINNDYESWHRVPASQDDIVVDDNGTLHGQASIMGISGNERIVVDSIAVPKAT